MKKTHLLIAGSAISLALFTAAPSYAQDAPAADEPAAESAVDEKVITVTGSRIRLPRTC